ncbi:hypothetical protein Adt_11516 [Abeliophyllum distichum]|uniref:Uncharacterized protein n=1 Tax=Abeliophyllum distichum TaxID=126358 RepID=A0ABD1UNH0_9LAMI
MVKIRKVRGLILNKEVYNIVAGYESKFRKEEAKSKKLFKDLMAIGLEKAQLESDKRGLQFKLDLVVAKEADTKAKYEIELTALKKSSNNLEAMVAEKEKQLTEAKEEVDRVKAECADVEARVVLAYKEDFENTPEYMYPTNHFMTASREQLVERIGKTHLE